MKSLNFLIVFIVFCSVNGIRIFPLPGQNVPNNSKFGRFDNSNLVQASTNAAVNSRLLSATLPPLFSVQSAQFQMTQSQEVRAENGNVAHPLITSRTTPIRSPSITVSTARYINNERPSTAPPSTIGQSSALQTLNFAKNTSLENQSSSFGSLVQKPQTITTLRTAVEQPAKDLLPPLGEVKDSTTAFQTQQSTTTTTSTTMIPKLTVKTPFNDLLPPKASSIH